MPVTLSIGQDAVAGRAALHALARLEQHARIGRLSLHLEVRLRQRQGLCGVAFDAQGEAGFFAATAGRRREAWPSCAAT